MRHAVTAATHCHGVVTFGLPNCGWFTRQGCEMKSFSQFFYGLAITVQSRCNLPCWNMGIKKSDCSPSFSKAKSRHASQPPKRTSRMERKVGFLVFFWFCLLWALSQIKIKIEQTKRSALVIKKTPINCTFGAIAHFWLTLELRINNK